jgi:hypothetical protein
LQLRKMLNEADIDDPAAAGDGTLRYLRGRKWKR